jgi:hypothetical protein
VTHSVLALSSIRKKSIRQNQCAKMRQTFGQVTAAIVLSARPIFGGITFVLLQLPNRYARFCILATAAYWRKTSGLFGGDADATI